MNVMRILVRIVKNMPLEILEITQNRKAGVKKQGTINKL